MQTSDFNLPPLSRTLWRVSHRFLLLFCVCLTLSMVSVESAHTISFKADFNGDGYDDLAVGIPFKHINGVEDAGAVHVTYSAPNSGFSHSEFWHQDIQGVPDQAHARNRFGEKLAVGDFNRDGYDDLAVSVRELYVLPGQSGWGAVQLLYGSRNGLQSHGDDLMILDAFGDGHLRRAYGFGQALAVGDYNGDSYDDLAVGVPLYGIPGSPKVGVVMIYFGGANGLQSARPCRCNIFHEGQSESVDAREEEDHFGAALTAADFNGDGYDDLAVGTPLEDSEHLNLVDNGAVTVLYGGSDMSLSGVRHRFIETQVRGNEPANNDKFGEVLMGGDFDGDGYDDLAIGHPRDNIDDHALPGAVTIIFGGRGGLGNRREFWTEDLTGRAQSGTLDLFGHSLASADFNQDGYDDLAIGVPRQEHNRRRNTGQVMMLYGTHSGLQVKRDSPWHGCDRSLPRCLCC